MQVDVRPMETAARLLQPPDIQYQGSIADLSVQAERVSLSCDCRRLRCLTKHSKRGLTALGM
jgi:hypothetical protein